MSVTNINKATSCTMADNKSGMGNMEEVNDLQYNTTNELSK